MSEPSVTVAAAGAAAAAPAAPFRTTYELPLVVSQRRVDCVPTFMGCIDNDGGRVPLPLSFADASSTTTLPGDPRVWSSVHALPWGFTHNATVIHAHALMRMIQWFLQRAATDLPENINLIVQHTDGALLLDVERAGARQRADAPEMRPPERAGVCAYVKRSMAASHAHHHRLLLLWPTSDVRAPDATRDAFAKSVPMVGRCEDGMDAVTSMAKLSAYACSGVMTLDRGRPAQSQAVQAELASFGVPQCVCITFGADIDILLYDVLAWLQRSLADRPPGLFILGRSTSAVLELCEAGDGSGWLVEPSIVRRYMVALPPPAAPAAVSAAGTKRAREGETNDVPHSTEVRPKAARSGDAPVLPAPPRPIATTSDSGVSLAIIIPYRSQPAQNRELQLQRFADTMPAFLRAVAPPLRNFHIFVIEQSADGYKFNRGKLLNAGFAIASAPDRASRFGVSGTYNAFCFHDVDLLPKPPVGFCYSKRPERPVHIGAAWGHYKYDNYVGGIITLSEADFRRINGFPNDFWGWGGEDDELYARLQASDLLPVWKPDAKYTGCIEDMEATLIRERGGERAGTAVKQGGRSEWRSMWKNELRALHREFKHAEGLRTLRFDLVGRRELNADTTVFTVDLKARDDPCAEEEKPATPGVGDSPAAIEGFKQRKRESYLAMGIRP